MPIIFLLLLSCHAREIQNWMVVSIISKTWDFLRYLLLCAKKSSEMDFFFQYKVINPASIHYKAVPFFDKRRH